nr:TagK domain-containing protein [Burkholderia stagnalis]
MYALNAVRAGFITRRAVIDGDEAGSGASALRPIIQSLMTILKRFQRNEPAMTYARPSPNRTGAAVQAARADDAAPPPPAGPEAGLLDDDAVLELIGAVIAAEALAAAPGDAATGDAAAAAGGCAPAPARDLMESLYEQYCSALENPHASLAADWATQMTPTRAPLPDLRADVEWGADAAESIDTLLSGARVLDDAFGGLEAGDAPDPAAMEPTPEILRLFAPPEYHAAVARRPAPLPPAFTRQEHQMLAIDSPLPTAGRIASEDTR